MSVIKIGMACHKPSVLPKNPLFVPIQVGSAIAARRMEGMCHDDEGDNISAKNASYCELTAQYWLWKNQESPGRMFWELQYADTERDCIRGEKMENRHTTELYLQIIGRGNIRKNGKSQEFMKNFMTDYVRN